MSDSLSMPENDEMKTIALHCSEESDAN